MESLEIWNNDNSGSGPVLRSCQSCQIFFVKSSILGQFLYCNEWVVTPYDRTMSSYPCSSRLPNFNVNPALNIVQSKLSKCWIKCKLSKCWIKCISKKFTSVGWSNRCNFFDIFWKNLQVLADPVVVIFFWNALDPTFVIFLKMTGSSLFISPNGQGWKINSGLWAVVWAGLWNKSAWANYEQLLRPIFVFMDKESI